MTDYARTKSDVFRSGRKDMGQRVVSLENKVGLFKLGP